LIGWFAGRYIGNKLEQTQSQIKTLGQPDFDIKIHRLGELNPLSQALANHHQALLGQAAVSQALSQFIGTSDHANEAPINQTEDDTEHSHAAVLFINPMDLEAAHEHLSASELATLLNEYYGLIHQAAVLYNGHVDRYMGKGALVLFGVPHEDEKDCFHGVCMALLLIGLLNNLNQTRRSYGKAVIDFQLGLHAGTVLSTTCNDRVKVTQMSMCDTLHIAGRLSRKGQANRLLVSEDVIQHGQLAGQLILNKFETIKGPSSDGAIQSFWAENLTPNYQALIDRQVLHICNQLSGIQA
jgi:class 3 adenylate cyclase